MEEMPEFSSSRQPAESAPSSAPLSPAPAPGQGANSDSEWLRWESTFAGSDCFYGHEPGPVAVRAEKYQRATRPENATALDVGCGEGQDLAYLASRGYKTTGVDFSPAGLEKAIGLLRERSAQATLLREDLRSWRAPQPFDMVLSVNVLPFLGEAADEALKNTLHAVKSGGMLGLSLWARDDERVPRIQNGIRVWTLEEAMHALAEEAQWQMKEVARVWQWSQVTDSSRAFITIIAQRVS